MIEGSLNSAKTPSETGFMDKPKPLKKQPKQKRSQAVVEAILGGATRILSSTPLGSATTDKIAEVAGVGVGSVYDYFPNKKSIVLALIDERLDALISKFEKMLDRSAKIPIEELIDNSLAFVTVEHLEKRFFLREIFMLAPESGRMEVLFECRKRAIQKLADHLIEHRGIDSDKAHLKAFTLIHMITGLIEGYVMNEDAPVSAEALRHEIRQIMLAMLTF
jgi:AcrR family transcriptional regulator